MKEEERNKLLTEFASLMNELNSNTHPDLDAFLSKYIEDEEFQKLAKFSQKLWGNLNKKPVTSYNADLLICSFIVIVAVTFLLFGFK